MILLRSTWADAPELGDATEESAHAGDKEMPDDARLIRYLRIGRA